MPSDAREIRGSCHVGAFYLPDNGAVGGYSSRSRPVDDPTHQTPQNLSMKAEAEESTGIARVTQGGGGVLPYANPYLGAPRDTFVYGGIAPDERHPVMNLIKGPSVTERYWDQGKEYGYNPVWDGESELSSVIETPVSYDFGPQTRSTLPAHQYPVIPSKVSYKYPGALDLTTYNIWKLESAPAANGTYRKYAGEVQADRSYGQPYLTQGQPTNGAFGSMSITVHALGSEAQVSRIYPMSKDLAYSGAQLFYPKTSGAELSPETIQATGVNGNCGFHVWMRYTNPTQNQGSNEQETRGGLRLIWGDNFDSDVYVNGYNLVFTAKEAPVLMYWNPFKAAWDRTKLTGPYLDAESNGEIEVFVHYVGSMMLIGFSNNPAMWNAVYPLQPDNSQRDYSSIAPHYISKDAAISLVVTNMSCVLQYGPIAFNNFNSTDFIVAEPESRKNYINVWFNSSSAYAPLVTETVLNNQLQKESLASTAPMIEDDKEATPSVQMDWRNQNPALILYSEKERTTDSVMSQINIAGVVRYHTTIEGPMFHHLRVPPSPPSEIDDEKLIHHFDWSDISEWMESWTVSYDYENTNHSILTSTATVKLRNIGLSDRGRKILTLLENNMLVVTLGAGYGDAVPYFRGFVIKSSTEYDGIGNVTVLTCQDVLSKIISDIPWLTTLNFSGMKYSRIIEYCMEKLGLLKFYEFQQVSENPLWLQSTGRRLGYAPIESPLAMNLLLALPTHTIAHTLNNVLGLILDERTLPIMFFDNSKDKFYVQNRIEKTNIDVLRFMGTLDEEGKLTLPNSQALYEKAKDGEEDIVMSLTDALHGVLSTKYTIDTVNDQLFAGYLLWGNSYESTLISKKKMFQEAWGKTSLEKFQNALSVEDGAYDDYSGYVGYRKMLMENTDPKSVPDRLSMEIYGSAIEPLIQKTIHSVSFSCYVTKPLVHQGGFRIRTLIGYEDYDVDAQEETVSGNEESNQKDSTYTDCYFYSKIGYSFSKEDNLLRADITGVRFPSIV